MSEQLLVAEADASEEAADPASAGPSQAAPSPAEADPLLSCLVTLAIHHDRPVAREALIAGLPLADGRLTPGLFARAAQRIGYAAQLVKRPLQRLNPLALPAVLLLEDGDACLVFKVAKGAQAEIYDPATDSRTSVAWSDLEAAYTGKAILVKPRAEPGQHDGQRAAAAGGHWFWGVIRLLWPTYAQVIVAAALINILALASPLFIMNVYDRVLPNKAIPTLWVLALGIGLAILFDLLLRSLRGRLIDGAGRRADVVLASRIYEHVLGLKFAARPDTTGSFANRLADFEQVREFFTSGTLATLTDVAFFGLFFLVIYMVAGPLAYIPAVAAVLVVVIGLILQFPLRRAARASAVDAAQRHSLLVESIAALETVKSLRAEGRLQRQWEDLVGRTSRTFETARKHSSMIQNSTFAVQQLVTVAIVIGGTYMFDQGDITMGGIIAAVILSGRCVAPFGQFSTLIARTQQSFAALGALNQIMAMESERPAGKQFIAQPITAGKIEFRSVRFTYPGAANPAINDLDLVIEPGEKVGVIGKIGSGKTTIGRLLCGLHDVSEGSLLIDGIDIRQFHPHEVRRAVGFVSQDADLFFGTLRDNILMGAPGASDEDFLRASRLAGVDDFALKHPQGYDMQIGERGRALSGGQRQAVTLARIFLLDPQIIFLDEPSGAMDLASERDLIRRLKQATRPEQTLIVATHRYSMLDLVDRLVVLSNGRAGADGPKHKVLEVLKDNALQDR
ncbi:MAG: type I secretion system permease/ATPase, partial [Hyphomicrobiales bacterium]